MRKQYVIGNWKMNGSIPFCREFIPELNNFLQKQTSRAEVVVCPPFTLLSEVQSLISLKLLLGAQDLSPVVKGARTGEISASMLLEQGCRYVLVGHSERRHILGEKNNFIADKFFAAKTAGLIPILCVGETRLEREAGDTKAVVSAQLDAVLSQQPNAFEGALLAYEPVWAIGTGLSATPEEAGAVHSFLRQELASSCPILYGGSVTAAQTGALLQERDIDGVLVGGASLLVHEFIKIIECVQ